LGSGYRKDNHRKFTYPCAITPTLSGSDEINIIIFITESLPNQTGFCSGEIYNDDIIIFSVILQNLKKKRVSLLDTEKKVL
jgi:hypothetical protein